MAPLATALSLGALCAGPAGGLDAACPHGKVFGAPASLEPLEALFGQSAHDDRDMRRTLTDPCCPAAGTGAPALLRRALVHVARRYEQFISLLAVVVDGIGHGRLEHLRDDRGSTAFQEPEQVQCLVDRLVTDCVDDLAKLVGADQGVVQYRPRALAFVGLGACHLALPLPFLAGVVAERPRRGELAELVANHRLGDVHGHVLAPVVYSDRVAHHVGDDRRTA